MRTKILMLAVLGFAIIGNANAQETSKYAKNYKVCRADGKYKICDNIKDKKQEPQKAEQKPTVVVLPCTEPVVERTYVIVGQSTKDNPRFRVSYDQPGDVYKGKEVMSNDGVAKNIERNINYRDYAEGTPNPPNDGGLAVR